jgi:hypothetical protein
MGIPTAKKCSAEAAMNTRFSTEPSIQDLRNHPIEVVLALQKLLACGARITPDPKRPGFYEVESGSLVYYICESVSSGKILLLATWPSKSALDEVLQPA